MSYQRDELARLRSLALAQWGVVGHVIPYVLADQTLYQSVRQSALDYFERNRIKWWASKYDARTKGPPARPTGHLTSSQVACVNHLEPARIDRKVAEQVVQTIEPGYHAVPTAPNSFVEYEWIGNSSYLGEKGARRRGANITSLDALMCGERDVRRILLAFEWKYRECYGLKSVATSRKGTDRVATYRPLLVRADCPIRVGKIEWLFFEPYYQLMRQTLLVWQMVEHGEFGASDWLHIHVVPELNVALRRSKATPDLAGWTMHDKWRSVLKDPDRYRLMTATELLAGVGGASNWNQWRTWLNTRYLT